MPCSASPSTTSSANAPAGGSAAGAAIDLRQAFQNAFPLLHFHNGPGDIVIQRPQRPAGQSTRPSKIPSSGKLASTSRRSDDPSRRQVLLELDRLAPRHIRIFHGQTSAHTAFGTGMAFDVASILRSLPFSMSSRIRMTLGSPATDQRVFRRQRSGRSSQKSPAEPGGRFAAVDIGFASPALSKLPLPASGTDR